MDPFIIVKSEKPWVSSKIETRQPSKMYWTKNEDLLYIDFFERFPHFAESFAQRKANKIFIQMSKFIRSRTPNQIKSHHQKLLLKHGSLNNALAYLSVTRKDSQEPTTQFSLSDSLLDVSQESHSKRIEGEKRSN